jgi:chaperonin GroES
MAEVIPLYDKVLVIKDKTEEVTEGGIHIPSSAVKEQITANVIAIGEGRLNSDGEFIPLRVQVDDRVIIGKFSGTEFEVEGQNMILIREDDILAILK